MNFWWGDESLVGWRQSTRGIFTGGGMSKCYASSGGTPSPFPPLGETLFILDILAKRHKKTNA